MAARCADTGIRRGLQRSTIPAYFVFYFADSENSKRSRRKPWSYEHLENGFGGAFFKWTPESPVMSVVDTKRWLAGVKALVDRS